MHNYTQEKNHHRRHLLTFPSDTIGWTTGPQGGSSPAKPSIGVPFLETPWNQTDQPRPGPRQHDMFAVSFLSTGQGRGQAAIVHLRSGRAAGVGLKHQTRLLWGREGRREEEALRAAEAEGEPAHDSQVHGSGGGCTLPPWAPWGSLSTGAKKCSGNPLSRTGSS